MLTLTEQLKTEIEAASRALNLEPTTIGRLVGQGGAFYKRLESGARVWPETAADVRGKLREMLGKAGHDPALVSGTAKPQPSLSKNAIPDTTLTGGA